MVMVYGILAAVLLTVENMTNKHLMLGLRMDPKLGGLIGIVYLLIEGTIGTIALIVLSIFG